MSWEIFIGALIGTFLGRFIMWSFQRIRYKKNLEINYRPNQHQRFIGAIYHIEGYSKGGGRAWGSGRTPEEAIEYFLRYGGDTEAALKNWDAAKEE